MIKKEIKQETLFVALLLLSIFTILISLTILNPSLLWDENAYLGNARSHITISNYTEDFRFPLLEYVISLFWLFGESVLIAKIIVIFFAVASIFLIFLISKKYFKDSKNKNIPIFLTLAFAFSPLIIIWGFRIYTEMLTLFLILLSFWFFALSEDNTKKTNILVALAGIASGLAFLSRFTSIIFAFSCGLYLLFKKDFKKIFIFGIGFIIIISPWLVFNQLNYNDALWDLKSQYSIVSMWTTPESPVKEIFNLFSTTGIMPLLAIVGLAFLVSCLKRKDFPNKSIRIISAICLILSIIYCSFFVNIKYQRYIIGFLPFIYILGFEGYLFLSKKLKKREFLIKVLNILIILSTILLFLYCIFSLNILSCHEKAIGQTIDYLKPHANEINLNNQLVLSNFWPYLGYGLNVKISSFWNPDINVLLDSMNVSHIAYSSTVGENYNLTSLDSNKRIVFSEQFRDDCQTIYLYRVLN